MRVPQPEGTRGSLKWLQRAVARRPDLLGVPALGPVTWLSPLRSDDYAEYRDAAFLDLLGLGALHPALADFWPRGGPQWDALGRAGPAVVLVEAKAHLREFMTTPSQAAPPSLRKIRAAFSAIQADLGIDPPSDWSRIFYQYANRLAHLWWLRRQGVEAHLLFVSFLGDDTPGIEGPVRHETWEAAFALADHALGLPARHRLSAFVHHAMPGVDGLR